MSNTTQRRGILNRRGISLIETLICIAVLSASVFGASTAIVNASYQTNEDRHRWNGSEIGSYVLEQLVYAYISNGLLNQGNHHLYFQENFTPVLPTPPATAPAPGTYFYDVEWFVNQNTPVAGVYDIQLWVHWLERNNPRQVTFETYR